MSHTPDPSLDAFQLEHFQFVNLSLEKKTKHPPHTHTTLGKLKMHTISMARKATELVNEGAQEYSQVLAHNWTITFY